MGMRVSVTLGGPDVRTASSRCPLWTLLHPGRLIVYRLNTQPLRTQRGGYSYHLLRGPSFSFETLGSVVVGQLALPIMLDHALHIQVRDYIPNDLHLRWFLKSRLRICTA